jgi:hypothetical protein
MLISNKKFNLDLRLPNKRDLINKIRESPPPASVEARGDRFGRVGVDLQDSTCS